jgi:hypothetical protein
MSTNPQTGIDPTIDRFAIFRTSTQSFINLNAVWPRTDGGPLVGANPDLKYYKRVTAQAPDADHRFTVEATWGKVDTEPTPPEGYPSGIYTQSFETIRRPVDELKLQVDSEFQRQVRLQFPDSENPATIIEAAGVIARKQAGSPVSPSQQAILDSFVGMEDQISYMRHRQIALYAAIDADEDYDITIGWTAP